jgi:hypothetical protein
LKSYKKTGFSFCPVSFSPILTLASSNHLPYSPPARRPGLLWKNVSTQSHMCFQSLLLPVETDTLRTILI